MTAFLINHPSGYSLTCGQFFTSAFFPPLSASIFAGRHNDCADRLNAEGESACCHRFVAFLEYIPVVGAVVAIVERIMAFVYKLLCSETEQPPPNLSDRAVQILEDTQSMASLANATLEVALESEPVNSSPDPMNHLFLSPAESRSGKLHDEVNSSTIAVGSPRDSTNPTSVSVTVQGLSAFPKAPEEVRGNLSCSLTPEATRNPTSPLVKLSQENNSQLDVEGESQHTPQTSFLVLQGSPSKAIASSRSQASEEENSQRTIISSDYLQISSLSLSGVGTDSRANLSPVEDVISTPPEKRSKQVQIREDNNTVLTFIQPSLGTPVAKKAAATNRRDAIKKMAQAKQRAKVTSSGQHKERPLVIN